MREFTPSDKAVNHILRQIGSDGDFRFLMGPLTESFELLVAARADQAGQSFEAVEAEVLAMQCSEPRIAFKRQR